VPAFNMSLAVRIDLDVQAHRVAADRGGGTDGLCYSLLNTG
jgi:hypothetical protein